MTMSAERHHDVPSDPHQEMWVFRFQRDGKPREIHQRRGEQPDPAFFARMLATSVDGPVMWTPAYITTGYRWQLSDDDGITPLWRVVEPKGARRARRVEACPNGCGQP